MAISIKNDRGSRDSKKGTHIREQECQGRRAESLPRSNRLHREELRPKYRYQETNRFIVSMGM